MKQKPVVVIGDGWAALGAVGFLVTSGAQVEWITGQSTRILPLLATLENGQGIKNWSLLAQRLGIETGEERSGGFLREFRNKAFREPMWVKAPSMEARQDVIDETLWAPERKLVYDYESRFQRTLLEIEMEIRHRLVPAYYSNLTIRDGIPLNGFRKENDQITAVILGSGEEIETDQVVYADRWGLLPTLEGLPKGIPFLRKIEPYGLLQATFSHDPAVGVGVQECFYAALHRDSGEKFDRHVWGYFTEAGTRSSWTVCLTHEEVENNHDIAKKFRKLKSTLDRIFAGNPMIPPGKSNFASTCIEEKVRFSEESVYADNNEQPEPYLIPKLDGIVFLTDGYGPSRAMEQVGTALGIGEVIADDTSENESSSVSDVAQEI